jgi:repressor of nif and glnA expression
MGIEEISNARVRDKVGLAISRIEILAFHTSFDPSTGKGLLPVNISLFPESVFGDSVRIMAPVFEAGYAVSPLVAVARPGQRLGQFAIPSGKVGLATVCSLVVNGVLLKNGIPMDSKFGGILQVKKGKPLRFVELIYYSGSSLDPSEAFIRGRMTSIQDVIDQGEGKILANFREIPSPCMDNARDIVEKLKKADIKGVLKTGETGEPVCQIPVDIHKVGMILIGGLNPIASVC